MEKTCCITGHRDIALDKLEYVGQELQREIDEALRDGYRTFITGFAQGTDLLFARLVEARRKDYPDIFLEAALPYAGRIKQLTRDEKARLNKCNGIKIISDKYHSGCFMQRNRYLVQSSSRVIAVYDGRATGGTFQTIRFARVNEKDLRIIEI